MEKEKVFGFPIEHYTDSQNMIEQMKNADEGNMFLVGEKTIKQHEGDDIVELTWAKIIRTRDIKDN